MTDEQVFLLMWVEYYAKIYELDDLKRPPDPIIEDDNQLDNWSSKYRAEQRNKLADYYRSIEGKSSPGDVRRVTPEWGKASNSNG